MLATQEATLFTETGCSGNSSATFTSSGNAFFQDFAPYVKNLWSVKLCGKGTFFYFSTPDMQMLSTLGHISRCGSKVTKEMEECECQDLTPETAKLVQSFSLQYC